MFTKSKNLKLFLIAITILVLSLMAGIVYDYLSIDNTKFLIALRTYGDKDIPVISADNAKLQTRFEKNCGEVSTQPRTIKNEAEIKRFYAEQKESKTNPDLKIADLADKCIYSNSYKLQSLSFKDGFKDIDRKDIESIALDRLDTKKYSQMVHNNFILSGTPYDFTSKGTQVKLNLELDQPALLNRYTLKISNTYRSKEYRFELPILESDKFNQQFVEILGVYK
jgi:hypothetical protein